MCIRDRAYTKQKADKKAMEDYRELAKDTRNPYGAEAKYQVAQSLYDAKEYAAAEKELLNYIEPVSYTHLDVYKRQVMASRIIATSTKTLVTQFYHYIFPHFTFL